MKIAVNTVIVVKDTSGTSAHRKLPSPRGTYYGKVGQVPPSIIRYTTLFAWGVSQNHCVVGFERTSGDHPVQTSCQSRLCAVGCTGKHPDRFLISAEKVTPQHLGSLFYCSVTLKVKNFFLLLVWNFCMFQFVPAAGHHAESLVLPYWHPSFRYLTAFIRSMEMRSENEQKVFS